MMDLLRNVTTHARLRPDSLAYREVTPSPTTARALTYSQLADQVDSLASHLRTQFPPGSTLLIRIPNQCDYPIAFLATLAANCCAFPVPPDISAPELHSALTQSGATAILTPGRTLTAIPQSAIPNPQSRHGLLLQSSGTTGRPKIVYRPAPAIDAVCSNMLSSIRLTPADRVLATVPLCHSYGLEHGLLTPLSAGASTHLCQGFDLPLVLNELTSNGITTFPAVPSMFEMLAQLADDHTRFPSLRTVYSAGGPLPTPVADTFFSKYHLRISQLYGASEIGSVTFTPATDPTFSPASVGRPMPGVEIRIAPPTDPSTSLPHNEEGQILIRATSMFTGYLSNDPILTPDGFFPTGDLGRLDPHHNLTVTGRIKLLIDVGGLKVNPLEVEDVLLQHPGVAACIVVPVRLSQTISRIKAVIRPTHPATPPAVEDLRKFAKSRLTPHKVPRLFEFRDSLPTSPAGKILRHLVET